MYECKECGFFSTLYSVVNHIFWVHKTCSPDFQHFKVIDEPEADRIGQETV